MNLDCRTNKSEIKFMNYSFSSFFRGGSSEALLIQKTHTCRSQLQSWSIVMGVWRLAIGGWLEISTPTHAVIWERQQETVWNRRKKLIDQYFFFVGCGGTSLGIHASCLILKEIFTKQLDRCCCFILLRIEGPLVHLVVFLFTTCEIVSGRGEGYNYNH